MHGNIATGGGDPANADQAPLLWRWYRMPLPSDPWPKVARSRDTVTARPGFARIGLLG
ncbi:MAG: hypothetical protein ACR2NR_10215 [Solirubrobacteraceae bacterium]